MVTKHYSEHCTMNSLDQFSQEGFMSYIHQLEKMGNNLGSQQTKMSIVKKYISMRTGKISSSIIMPKHLVGKMK